MAHGKTDPSSDSTGAVFKNIYCYPWEQDSTFQSGYLSILEQTAQRPAITPIEHDVDLLLEAQCFFFARKHNLSAAVDIAAYKAWIQTGSAEDGSAPLYQARKLHASLFRSSGLQDRSSSAFLPEESIDASDSVAAAPQGNARQLISTPESGIKQQLSPEPPYPTSFAAIVELITRNEAIPGIEEIPDTVLDVSLSPPNKTARRQKPWEKIGINSSTTDVSKIQEHADSKPLIKHRGFSGPRTGSPQTPANG